MQFDDEDAAVEDAQEGETPRPVGEANALEIFSNPTLGLTAVDFARLFSVARGYWDEGDEAGKVREQ